MGFIKSVKRGLIYGGLVGALAGSQFPSIPKAYEEVLETNLKEKEIVLDYIKDNRKKDVDKETYKATLEEIQEEYNEAKEKLNEYESMEDNEQKKEALKDIKNYGMTLKEMDFGLNKDSPKGAKKGGMYGAGAGVVLLGGASIRRGLKRKNKNNLEKRLSIFLGLLAGGIGLNLTFSNFSGVVTGNVIRNASYSSSGIIGIILLVAGCIGTYFYFKN